MQKGLFISGFQEGYWEYYYEDGSIRAKGNWQNGMMTGFWEYFDKNGDLEEIKRY